MNNTKRAVTYFDNRIDIYSQIPLDTEGELILASYKQASLALKEKVERENPKSLTLSELKQMEGQPVWWVTFKEQKFPHCTIPPSCFWRLAGKQDEKMQCFNVGFANLSSYGKVWTAYAHKPKEDR